MKDEGYLFERYKDLLDEHATPDLVRLIHDLDALRSRRPRYVVEPTERVLLDHAAESRARAGLARRLWLHIISAIRTSTGLASTSLRTENGRRGISTRNGPRNLPSAILLITTVFITIVAVVTLVRFGSSYPRSQYAAHPTVTPRHPIALELMSTPRPHIVSTKSVRVMPPAGPVHSMYVTEDITASPGMALLPLDPQTLARDTSREVIPILPGATADLSADGKTAVQISEDTNNVRTVDTSTGRMLASFQLPAPISPDTPTFLSSDGSKLVFVRDNRGLSSDRSIWYVVDTMTGRTLTTVPTIRTTMGTVVFVNQATTRLYLVAEGSGDFRDTGPTLPLMEEYDLKSGDRIADTELRGVLAGSWHMGRNFRGLPVFKQWTPGVALSPDGDTIAIVHPDSDTITLLDAHSLRLERTLRFEVQQRQHASSMSNEALANLAGPLGGVTRQAIFSPDGKVLYVTGSEIRYIAVPKDRQDPRGEGDIAAAKLHLGLALQAVDPRTGQVIASQTLKAGANETAEYSYMQPSPDGRWLYVTTCTNQIFYTPSEVGERCSLERLDPQTLGLMAQREINDAGQVFFYGATDDTENRK